MTFDTTFTNGVIAVKEKQLLGEKVFRFPELTVGEVVRALSESGFGGGESSPDAIYAYEQGVLDDFIRTYAPGEAEKNFFLAPRDFHNLKALYKAERLGRSADGMLAPAGMRSIDELKTMLAEKKGLPEIGDDATGAEIGAAFDRAEFQYLFRACALRPILKKLLRARADMTNLLTAFRASSMEEAESLFLQGGKLKKEDLMRVFSEDPERRAHAPAKFPYAEFYGACAAAKEKGLPLTDAERMKEEFETRFFFEKRFALSGKEPFLYYVFRRKAEISNVRTVLICLNAGVSAREIGKRLFGVK